VIIVLEFTKPLNEVSKTPPQQLSWI